MNIADQIPIRALQTFEPDPEAIYDIEAVVRLAHVPRHSILVYYNQGLISTVFDPEREGFYFDDEAIRMLRRIEYLRSDRGLNLAGTKMVLDLMEEVKRLRAELRFRRE